MINRQVRRKNKPRMDTDSHECRIPSVTRGYMLTPPTLGILRTHGHRLIVGHITGRTAVRPYN
jgi:hypothetical protein